MRRKLICSVAAAVLIFAAAQANATILVAGSGWEDDEITAPGVPTTNSAWTFTIATPSILSIVDGFIPGDIYTLSGDLTGVTTFYAGSASAVQASGTYGAFWPDATYSKVALWVAPGTYSFSITGNGAGGTPSGLGIRLDAVDAVPEPASWVMMAGALGIVGMTMRRRRAVPSSC